MKVLGWILFFSLNTTYAQQVVESAPLSVEDDGARKITVGERKVVPIVEKKEVLKVEPVEVKSEALEDIVEISKKDAEKLKSIIVTTPIEVVPTAKVDSQDGQLKLGALATPPDEIIIDDTQQSIVANQDEKKVEIVAFEFYEYTLKKYLQFSIGYLGSNYKKVDPNLGKGSALSSIRFVSDVTHKFQSGFAIEILSDMSDQKIPESVRSIQYRLFVDYHAALKRGVGLQLDWVSGLSLSFGDYSLKRHFVNAQGLELSQKIKDGTIIGLIPAVGLRFYLGSSNSIDLMAEYHLYFGKPQKYIGGFAFSPRINFVF